MGVMKEVIQLEQLPPGTFMPALILSSVSLMHREIWHNPDPTESVAVRHLRNKHLVVAKSALAIVSAGTLTTTDIGSAIIHDLVTDPEYRGQGYGTIVLDCLEQTARCLGSERVTLHAIRSNEGFFVHQGYEQDPSSPVLIKYLAAA